LVGGKADQSRAADTRPETTGWTPVEPTDSDEPDGFGPASASAGVDMIVRSSLAREGDGAFPTTG
jgi:hypothetical protein